MQYKRMRGVALDMTVSMSLNMCFFEQKTAYEMRISDWSSDVCSSDLRSAGNAGPLAFRQSAGRTQDSDQARHRSPAGDTAADPAGAAAADDRRPRPGRLARTRTFRSAPGRA